MPRSLSTSRMKSERLFPTWRTPIIEMNRTNHPYHPLTFVAFLVAFFLLIPLADALFVMLLRKHHLQAALCAIFSLAGVIVPLLYAERQTRRHPDRWSPRFLMKVTWAIVFLTLIYITFVFADAVTKTGPSANQSAHGTR